MKRGIWTGALPESSGAEPGGCTASRAPQHRGAGRSRPSLGVGPPRAWSGHIWFSRNWEASHWLCCPRTGARPPTDAESGRQLGSGKEAGGLTPFRPLSWVQEIPGATREVWHSGKTLVLNETWDSLILICPYPSLPRECL